jgi:hypothetical protein
VTGVVAAAAAIGWGVAAATAGPSAGERGAGP